LPPTRSSGPTDSPPRKRGWLLILAGVLVVGLVAGVLVVVLDGNSEDDGMTQRGAVAPSGGAEVGSPAPDFVLPALEDGGEVRLADFRGRPVIVNFWASWCNPCRDEFPLLKEALRDNRADRLAVIGVTYRDIPRDSRDFVAKMNAGWPQAIDDDRAVAEAFGVRSIPITFFIRPDGTLAARLFGFTSEADLADPIGKLLAR
jgi:cytochrome c biogenesis protein CcmG, thiol:disulfide interchange protein DsbE